MLLPRIAHARTFLRWGEREDYVNGSLGCTYLMSILSVCVCVTSVGFAKVL